MTSVKKLFRFEQASGLLMIGAMLLALAAANSPLASAYRFIHHVPVHVRLGPLVIDEPLVQWINEGLMVFFFLLVGLEIKRQFLEGHLSTWKCAALPAIAAMGGMMAPAAIYWAFTSGDPEQVRGWAIPTATDIVLALGILSLLGSRVPAGLKVFLTALAIFDDVGAVLIIGLFYGEDISLAPLLLATLAISGLVALNRFGIAKPLPYVVVGLLLWITMLEAGAAPAVSGVLVALAVPLHTREVRALSPLRAAERRLHPWATLLIVPLFAFFNSGIGIHDGALAGLLTPVSLGIALGLFLGKQVGIMGAAWTAVRLGFAELPRGMDWAQVYGGALLAGIGFTMSLFVTTQAFSDPTLIASAKLAILAGSLMSGCAGFVWLRSVIATLPPARGASVDSGWASGRVGTPR